MSDEKILNELSPETLRSYLKSARSQHNALQKYNPKSSKIQKRSAGIKKAEHKLTKPVADKYNEVIKKTFSKDEMDKMKDRIKQGRAEHPGFNQWLKDKGKPNPYKEEKESGLQDACWKGYEAIGTKVKNGKAVPNCVPKKESVNEESYYKVQINNLPDVFMTATSPTVIRQTLLKILKKSDEIQGIDKVTGQEVRNTFRMRSQGKDQLEM